MKAPLEAELTRLRGAKALRRERCQELVQEMQRMKASMQTLTIEAREKVRHQHPAWLVMTWRRPVLVSCTASSGCYRVPMSVRQVLIVTVPPGLPLLVPQEDKIERLKVEVQQLPQDVSRSFYTVRNATVTLCTS